MSDAKTKKAAYEKSLLLYFNSVLREKGLITEENYWGMRRRIEQRK